jgi:DNA-binding GntR family transcriptional regulator
MQDSLKKRKGVAAGSSRFPFEPVSLAERAYLTVREKILKGELPLGVELPRRKVASELGMSLVPVSEAFQRLTSEGLLESKPRVGTRVYLPTMQDMADRFLLREALESQSARLFSLRATAREKRELCQMADHIDVLFDRRPAAKEETEFNYQVQTFHFQFHMRIAECARCPPLTKMIEQTHLLVFNWVCDLAAQCPALPRRSHRSLMDVLVRGNPLASDAAMRAHLEEAAERMTQAMDVGNQSAEGA